MFLVLGFQIFKKEWEDKAIAYKATIHYMLNPCFNYLPDGLDLITAEVHTSLRDHPNKVSENRCLIVPVHLVKPSSQA